MPDTRFVVPTRDASGTLLCVRDPFTNRLIPAEGAEVQDSAVIRRHLRDGSIVERDPAKAEPASTGKKASTTNGGE
jgi:hypothetical protein